MLEFNLEHKVADMSMIKAKTEKVRKTGKVVLCGVMLSAVLLLSGCDKGTYTAYHSQQATAIIMENGNAMIVDLSSYCKYYYGGDERTFVLETTSGDTLLVDTYCVKFVEGYGSHEKAETIAQALISENGQITCYDEVQNYGKIR